MRAIISLVIASVFILTSLPAMAEPASAEAAQTKASAPPAASDKASGAAQPAPKEKIVEPAVSGLDQQLCVQK